VPGLASSDSAQDLTDTRRIERSTGEWIAAKARARRVNRCNPELPRDWKRT
jgi:hypothetical protein